MLLYALEKTPKKLTKMDSIEVEDKLLRNVKNRQDFRNLGN